MSYINNQIVIKIIGNIFSSTEYFRSLLANDDRICIINPETEGLASLFIIKPPKYNNMSLTEILNLPDKEIIKIRDYNINYSKYILELAKSNMINFTFTSSRSYTIPGTSIKIGALKAYPMSVFQNKKEITHIFKQIDKTITEYNKINNNNFENKIYISDNMVYRENDEKRGVK